MSNIAFNDSIKDKISSFLWQHFLLAVSLFIMTFGVALCVRSALGSSVISAIPFVMSIAGESNMVPELTIGEYTYLMNALFVGLQVILLNRRFKPVQLFQLVIGFLFGYFLDLNMILTSIADVDSLLAKIMAQLAGCTVLGLGISLEIRCGSVTMPGEGITVAVSQVTGMPFAKAKIIVDTLLVVTAVILGYCFFGSWMWNVIGPGTLFAMIYVGALVRWLDPYMEWFSRILSYRPGFRRYIFGLARFIYRRRD